MDIPGRRQIKLPRLSNRYVSVVRDHRNRNRAQLRMTNANLNSHAILLFKYSQYMLLTFISGPAAIVAKRNFFSSPKTLKNVDPMAFYYCLKKQLWNP